MEEMSPMRRQPVNNWQNNDLAVFTALAVGVWIIISFALLTDKTTGWDYLNDQPYHPSLYYSCLRGLIYLFLAINLTTIIFSIRDYNPIAGILLVANLPAVLVLTYWLPLPYPALLIVWLCGLCLFVIWLESRPKKKRDRRRLLSC